jgi:multiple sugar transport system ATP-binding protein
VGVTGLYRATVVHPDGSVALSELTLLADQGEVLVVLGPSGSGKTMLLKAVAGLAAVRSGQVLIDGQRATALPTHKRDLAMVFEQNTLLPFLNVAKNVAFALETRRLPAAEVDARVSRQARGLRLGRLLSRMPATLSAGESEQVGIARALVRIPSAFLLDEPLAHLDSGERASMRRHIIDAVRQAGVTTIYVTHDQADALAIADRVAVLNEGALVQLAPPRELYLRPADLFVAGFVGSAPIGLLPARVVVSGATAGFQVGSRTLPTWAPLAPELQVGQEVVLGLRAEDVLEASGDVDPELVTLPGTVTRVEQTGPIAIVTVSVAAPPVTAPGADPADARVGSAVLRARFPGRTTARVGSTVQVSVDIRYAHVFDPVTGQALRHPALSAPA